MTRIAIMQPYFLPYAGYFRLFSGSDLMVLYDDVQFPKEGWVHRNRLLDQRGQSAWLTLPMKKMPLKTKIRDLIFSDNYKDVWQDRLRRFPLFQEQDDLLTDRVRSINGTPLSFITELLKVTCEHLSLTYETVNSSSLEVDPSLSGQDRVIAIVKHLGGTEYINAPGGRSLYDADAFQQQDIKLLFLQAFNGDSASILQRLANESAATLHDEILAGTQVEQ